MLGGKALFANALDAKHPMELEHAGMREDITHGRPLPRTPINHNAYHALIEDTYSNDCQQKKLAQSLPNILLVAAEKEIEGVTSSIDNLCKWVEVVEEVITTLKTNMNDLKGKALVENCEMDKLVEVSRAPRNTFGPIDALMWSMRIVKEGG
ncbi:hypothetical protein KY284_001373 [Solanum tuberosum]|nr:hypothetical protein KY284_001373 [Solanum tuberosum]